MYCSQCKKEVQSGNRFCNHCGHKIEVSDSDIYQEESKLQETIKVKKSYKKIIV